jgi:hypothetical protein
VTSRVVLASIAAIVLSLSAAAMSHHRGLRAAEQAAAPQGPHHMVLPELSKERTFDGIELHRYSEFWNDWHLVTTRFRRDNGEQRFVYANDIAWRAMRSKAHVYPDGAMFGKVAFGVGEDPSFPNSVEPRRFSRIQLMKKDTRAYPENDGWGYAIVVGDRPPPYDSAETTVKACHACHRLVPERDFVFSTPSFLGDGYVAEGTHQASFQNRFSTQDPGTLSAFQRRAIALLPPRRKESGPRIVRSATMPLFGGSVNESIGVLSAYTLADSSLYAIWDEPSGSFVLAEWLPAVSGCERRAVVAFASTATTTSMSRIGQRPLRTQTPPQVLTVCDGQIMH